MYIFEELLNLNIQVVPVQFLNRHYCSKTGLQMYDANSVPWLFINHFISVLISSLGDFKSFLFIFDSILIELLVP